MNKVITYLLLLAYSIMMLKPVLPYVTDVLAHTFFNAQHIATVHFENGKYHVHKETMAAAKKSGPEKNAALIKSFSTEDIYLIESYCWQLLFIVDKQKDFPSFTAGLYNIHTGYNAPPPRV